MSLEQRVQVVEKEIDLLKAQIQMTLLKIQEHLLNSSYPTLHAQETAVKVTRQPSIEEEQMPAAPPLTKKVSSFNGRPERGIDPDEVFERIPPARNVVKLEEVPRFAPPAEPVIDAKQLQQAEQDAIAATWMELDKWVSQKVRELGMDRTRDLIQLYGGKERELLLRVCDVYDQNGQRSNRTPFAYVEPSYGRQSSAQPNLSIAEQWQRHANANKSNNQSGNRQFGDRQ